MKALQQHARWAKALQRAVGALAGDGKDRAEIGSFRECGKKSGAENVPDKYEHCAILHWPPVGFVQLRAPTSRPRRPIAIIPLPLLSGPGELMYFAAPFRCLFEASGGLPSSAPGSSARVTPLSLESRPE